MRAQKSPHNSILYIFRICGMAAIAASLIACTSSRITNPVTYVKSPDDWSTQTVPGEVTPNWISSLNSSDVARLVTEALSNNYLLATEAALLDEAYLSVTVARAFQLPDASLTLFQTRGRSVQDGTSATQSSPIDLSINVSWEVDLWGKLNDIEKSAQLSYAAQQARFEQAKRNLAANIASSYFNAVASQELLLLAERRLQNASDSEDIVDQSYQLGLSEALDLYLARNEVDFNESQLANQQQIRFESISSLQQQLGRYPNGTFELDSALPTRLDPIPIGVPSDLLTRRADLQQAWLNLLALDIELAIAHKNRFPSLILTGNLGMSERSLSDLLSSGNFLWNAAGNLSQPLFNAGRLAALEDQAAARVRQLENIYVDAVFNAFREVENAISQTRTLESSYLASVDAQSNADSALSLALEQYQNGLVTYTTVLESQRRAFDSAVTVIQLRNDLLQNRIRLHLALGGEFSVEG